MRFKFNQAGIPAELLLTGLQIPRCILREGGGLAPVEMCNEARYPCKATVTSHADLCKRLPSSRQSSWFLIVASTTKMPQHTRDLIEKLFIILFFSLGYKETQSWESTGSTCSAGLSMHDLVLILKVMSVLSICRLMVLVSSYYDFWMLNFLGGCLCCCGCVVCLQVLC